MLDDFKEAGRVEPGSIPASMAMTMLGSWRKLPVEIEAWQVGTYMDLGAVSEWVNASGGSMTYGQVDPGPAFGSIQTLEGEMRVDVGDFVIRGVQGEFYPCKPDIFRATYERVVNEVS